MFIDALAGALAFIALLFGALLLAYGLYAHTPLGVLIDRALGADKD